MPSSNKNRPVYLDLRTIRLPIGGVVSILHRLSGVLLVLLIPGLLFVLQASLTSEASFRQLTHVMQSSLVRLGIVLVSLALVIHLLAGLRHLMLDFDIGISRHASRRSAWWIMYFVVVIGLMGIWLAI